MNTLNEFEVFYQKMVATTSRLDKEAILKSYQDNLALKEVLHFLYF